MIIIIDSNVLYSAFHFPTERMRGLISFVTSKPRAFVPQYCVDEILNVTRIKSPDKIQVIIEYLRTLQITIYGSNSEGATGQPRIRDIKDQPILNAAIAIDADIILTGDKDFQALEIDRPRIMTPTQFIAEFMTE